MAKCVTISNWEEAFFLTYSLRVQSFLVGKGWLQECEVPGHVAHSVRMLREMILVMLGLPLPCDSIQAPDNGRVLPTVKGHLSTPMNLSRESLTGVSRGLSLR